MHLRSFVKSSERGCLTSDTSTMKGRAGAQAKVRMLGEEQRLSRKHHSVQYDKPLLQFHTYINPHTPDDAYHPIAASCHYWYLSSDIAAACHYRPSHMT